MTDILLKVALNIHNSNLFGSHTFHSVYLYIALTNEVTFHSKLISLNLCRPATGGSPRVATHKVHTLFQRCVYTKKLTFMLLILVR